MVGDSKLKRTLQALLYLSPALIVISVFTIYPLVKAFFMSLYTDYDFVSNSFSTYGLDNFNYILHDKLFFKALKNTGMFVLFEVPISVMLSLFIATLLNAKIRFQKFFQTLFFLPYVTSVVAIGIVWSWMFHSKYGLINYLLSWFGIDAIGWLNDPHYAIFALIIFSVWKSLAFNIMIFLAGLQSINPIYYEAARVDNTPKWRVFTRITVPLLSPMIAYSSIIGLISSFKVYTEVYALFGDKGGPANSALTVVFYIYEKFYGNWDFGVASAAAIVLFLIILFFTFIQMAISKKTVHY